MTKLKTVTWDQLDHLNGMDSIHIPDKLKEIHAKYPNVDMGLIHDLITIVYDESYDIGYISSHMEIAEDMGDGETVIVTPRLFEAMASLGESRGLTVKEEYKDGI